MNKPAGMLGIRHVALFIKDIESAVAFYTSVVGMHIEWQPDIDNVYLTNEGDVLALHRIGDDVHGLQRLDHIGFTLKTPQDVDAWYLHMQQHGVKTTEAPKTHRDGSRGFYCFDSVGTYLEFIYHPPIAKLAAADAV